MASVRWSSPAPAPGLTSRRPVSLAICCASHSSRRCGMIDSRQYAVGGNSRMSLPTADRMLNKGDLAMISMERALLDEFRQRLERDRDTLRAEIGQIEDQEVHAENQYDPEFSGYGNHMAETGTEIYEQERNLTLEQTLKQQLAEVEHALAKFDGGTYGICDNCGKDIAPERLQALPQAALCINCKGRQETQRR